MYLSGLSGEIWVGDTISLFLGMKPEDGANGMKQKGAGGGSVRRGKPCWKHPHAQVHQQSWWFTAPASRLCSCVCV